MFHRLPLHPLKHVFDQICEFAIAQHETSLRELLDEHRVTVNSTFGPISPIFMLAYQGEFDAVDFLLEKFYGNRVAAGKGYAAGGYISEADHLCPDYPFEVMAGLAMGGFDKEVCKRFKMSVAKDDPFFQEYTRMIGIGFGQNGHKRQTDAYLQMLHSYGEAESTLYPGAGQMCSVFLVSMSIGAAFFGVKHSIVNDRIYHHARTHYLGLFGLNYLNEVVEAFNAGGFFALADQLLLETRLFTRDDHYIRGIAQSGYDKETKEIVKQYPEDLYHACIGAALGGHLRLLTDLIVLEKKSHSEGEIPLMLHICHELGRRGFSNLSDELLKNKFGDDNKNWFFKGAIAGCQIDLVDQLIETMHLDRHDPRLNSWGGYQSRSYNALYDDQVELKKLIKACVKLNRYDKLNHHVALERIGPALSAKYISQTPKVNWSVTGTWLAKIDDAKFRECIVAEAKNVNGSLNAEALLQTASRTHALMRENHFSFAKACRVRGLFKKKEGEKDNAVTTREMVLSIAPALCRDRGLAAELSYMITGLVLGVSHRYVALLINETNDELQEDMLRSVDFGAQSNLLLFPARRKEIEERIAARRAFYF